MQKTSNYNLNKPEVSDPMRLADFNENADIIDGALKRIDNDSITRSAQVRAEAANALAAYQTSNDAAVNALNTTVENLNAAAAGFGNGHVAYGTYTGNGKYGSSNPTKLEVGFAPRIVLIGFNDGEYCRLYIPLLSARYDLGDTFSSETYTLQWGDTYFGIYSTSATGQMNSSGKVYTYLVIG